MMKKILTLIATMLIVIGCGDSDSSNKTFEGQMLVTQTYTMYPGDSVVKGSENAVISVTHKDGDIESTVTLIEGNVTILRTP
jgi:uncharacterized lipoprotein YehR (DUF1307 family)